MIFDGMKFTRSNKVVVLPENMWHDRIYVTFGRICPKDTVGAVKTDYYWKDRSPYGDSEEGGIYPTYAMPVERETHSLTNLMWGEDRYAYLYKDGKVYVRRRKFGGK